jgi:DNA mismatch repair protein MutS
VAEYIASVKTKALFATHYHELVDLENKIENVKNYHISVKEKGEDIVFLRKIVEGGTDESYGVHVAKLAGVPKDVTKRADDILKTFEKKNLMTGAKQTKSEIAEEQGQLSMYNYKLAELAHELDQVKLDEITPIDALNILSKMKDKMK